MNDPAERFTEEQIKDLDRRIHSVYSEAARDIQDKLNEFQRKFDVKNDIKFKEWKDGKITKDEYDRWMRGQIFQGNQWEAKRDQITHVMMNSNQVAAGIVNGQAANVFAMNATYMNYSLEHGAGVNFGFGVYDRSTVENLLKEDPQLLPRWKINEQKDYAWNKKQVNNAVTQGIIQGEKLDQITKRISSGLAMRNENLAKTFARTAMTGAQNAGRLESLENAEEMGIEVWKQWMATLDNHTRDSHQEIDGESVPVDQPFSNGLMYPADPTGDPAEVYNCRCTMVGDLKKYPAEYKRYDNIDGKPIDNMTFKEWQEAKEGGALEVIVDSFQSALGRAQTVAEINDLMNSQGWFRTDRRGNVSKADLTGCDLDSAKSIAASYEQVYTKYPQLIGRFDAPDAHPVGMKDKTYAWCYYKSNGRVQVNPTRYDNWAKITKDYEHDILTNWHPIGTTAESIVTHEIGHAIDGLLAREGILGGITSSGEYRLASSSLKNTIMKRAAKIDPEIANELEIDKWLKDTATVQHYVSRYAAENNKEWFAECFAEYITSANPRTVATEFGKELEKLMEKLS